MLSIILAFALRLSEYCNSPQQYSSPVSIDDFDIPFESCSITDFQNIEIKTTYKAIKDYQHRTLRLDNQLKFTINDVTSGDILTKLDIFDSEVTLNVSPNTPSQTIEGDIRLNRFDSSHLVINDGSFKVNPQKLIRFIHTNDVHCAYVEDSEKKTIGLSKFVSYVKNQKKLGYDEGFSVFSVDSGDFNQGLPLCNVNNGSSGHEAMKIVNYDAFTLGNHEWDWGHHNLYVQYDDFLRQNAPLIVGNVEDNSESEIMKFKPYLVKEVNSFGSDLSVTSDDFKIRVGIFGLLTPYTNVTTNPLEVRNINFQSDIVSLSQKYVKILREDEKCDVVVLICHLGYEQLDLTSNKIAESFDGIDVIIDGHSHTALNGGATRLNNDYTTLIAQTGSSFQNIGVVDILVDSKTKEVVGKRANLIDYDTIISMGIEDDSEMLNFLNNKMKEIEKITNVVVGKTLVDLDCRREIVRKNGRSKMGYLASTAILHAAPEADFSIINAGGIRAEIKAGDITYGHVVSVLPFGNQIVVLNVSGSQIHYLLRYGTRFYNVEEFGGFPTVSGLSFNINLDKSWEDEDRITGLRIVGENGDKNDIIINDDKHFYKLATTDFLYNGGDGYQSIVGVPRLNQYSTELNAALDYIKSLPDATVKGNEPFLTYPRIYENGQAPIRANKYERKRSISNIVYNNTVEVTSGYLNLLDFRNTMTNFTPFYNFSIAAKSIIASDLKGLEDLINQDLAYVGKDGYLIAAKKEDLVMGDSITDQAKPVVGEIETCNFFSKNGKDGKCKLDAAVVTIFTLMCVYIVIIIVLVIALVLVVVKSRKNSNYMEDETVDNKKNPLLNSENL